MYNLVYSYVWLLITALLRVKLVMAGACSYVLKEKSFGELTNMTQEAGIAGANSAGEVHTD